ncbi:unnamed protein product, partial [marine sediment metagenome]
FPKIVEKVRPELLKKLNSIYKQREKLIKSKDRLKYID